MIFSPFHTVKEQKYKSGPDGQNSETSTPRRALQLRERISTNNWNARKAEKRTLKIHNLRGMKKTGGGKFRLRGTDRILTRGMKFLTISHPGNKKTLGWKMKAE